ncbi:hypothetical protein YC2023_020631 [Brassica napus]
MKMTVIYVDIKPCHHQKQYIKTCYHQKLFFDNSDILTPYITRLAPKYTSHKASRGSPISPHLYKLGHLLKPTQIFKSNVKVYPTFSQMQNQPKGVVKVLSLMDFIISSKNLIVVSLKLISLNFGLKTVSALIEQLIVVSLKEGMFNNDDSPRILIQGSSSSLHHNDNDPYGAVLSTINEAPTTLMQGDDHGLIITNDDDHMIMMNTKTDNHHHKSGLLLNDDHNDHMMDWQTLDKLVASQLIMSQEEEEVNIKDPSDNMKPFIIISPKSKQQWPL